MHLTAWLIGDDAESVLNDLTAADGHPPAHTWVPLNSRATASANRLPRFRSAWTYRTTDGEQWIDFAIAAETIEAYVGAHALAHPKSLTHGTALRSNVEQREDELMVKVPRYFSTVTTHWTVEPNGQRPLIIRSGREVTEATIAEIDWDEVFGYDQKPDLIIDERGPRKLKRGGTRYYTVLTSVDADRIIREIRKLPATTILRSAWCAA